MAYFCVVANSVMNLFWSDYGKSYSSKSLSYASDQGASPSVGDYEFSLRYGAQFD